VPQSRFRAEPLHLRTPHEVQRSGRAFRADQLASAVPGHASFGPPAGEVTFSAMVLEAGQWRTSSFNDLASDPGDEFTVGRTLVGRCIETDGAP
jgi:hypothetical protein